MWSCGWEIICYCNLNKKIYVNLFGMCNIFDIHIRTHAVVFLINVAMLCHTYTTSRLLELILYSFNFYLFIYSPGNNWSLIMTWAILNHHRGICIVFFAVQI